jgi:hypothetical protein
MHFGGASGEICLADIGGPGLDLSGNLLCAD